MLDGFLNSDKIFLSTSEFVLLLLLCVLPSVERAARHSQFYLRLIYLSLVHGLNLDLLFSDSSAIEGFPSLTALKVVDVTRCCFGGFLHSSNDASVISCCCFPWLTCSVDVPQSACGYFIFADIGYIGEMKCFSMTLLHFSKILSCMMITFHPSIKSRSVI